MVKKREIKESLGISGFTLSILGIVFAGPNGLLLSIVSFIFCLIQQKNNPNKIGKAGLIISIIGFILSVVIIAIYIYFAITNVEIQQFNGL